jgi:hypothetical protein
MEYDCKSVKYKCKQRYNPLSNSIYNNSITNNSITNNSITNNSITNTITNTITNNTICNNTISNNTSVNITNINTNYAIQINNITNRLNYCNNCGTVGHSFSNCKYPITSVGIIAYRINPEKVIEYLMICRKDTIGFIEFMRGKYAINNKSYIRNLISEMTLDERNRLLTCDFDKLWYNLWGNCISNQFRNEEKNARDKFESLKLGFSPTFTLKTIINELKSTWTDPEWGFPKGRHNNLEKDLTCGLREFEEETGYPSHSVKVIQNILPYEEIFTGSNYKSYKHKYYVGQIDVLQKPHKRYQETEISKIEWCTYERAIELIRPYNLEKLSVLEKVNKVLSKYTTF